MPRQRRVVIPGIAHHITQRGNNRRHVFFTDEDRELYLSLLKEYAAQCGCDRVLPDDKSGSPDRCAGKLDCSGEGARAHAQRLRALASHSPPRVGAFMAESVLLVPAGTRVYLGSAGICGTKCSARRTGIRVRGLALEQCAAAFGPFASS
jgi:hypothetical protein